MDDQPRSSTGSAVRPPGISAALGAALLFGASTPLAKILLADFDPWLLAGLLYLGSGLGLTIYRLAKRLSIVIPFADGEWRWLAGATAAGGVIAPVLLMSGLMHMPASSASLLLNAEGVFTALLAWFVFRENFDARVVLGMMMIVAGAVVLSWPNKAETLSASMAIGPSLAVLGACVAWALDNNLTRKVSLADATWIACIKGLTAGVTNLVLAFVFTRDLAAPPIVSIAAALAVGCLAYGVSLSLFVVSLRHLGTARTGAYFSIAPFFGAALSVLLLHETLSLQLIVAGGLMALGVWLHLTEHHRHRHTHEPLEHEHEHMHDEHHQHGHDPADLPGGQGKHTHRHRHDPVTHDHEHYPDAHHRHHH